MGGFFGLPPLPQAPRDIGPAQYAPQGNMTPGPSPNPYLLPYKQPLAPTLIDGINQFMQQYKAQRDADKQRNASLFDKDIQNINLGMPVDLKKTAKYAKRAGLNIDFEGTAAQPPTPATPPSPAIQNAPGIPGGIPQGASNPGSPGTPGTPYQPAAPQSPIQGLLAKMGMTNPQINPQSPGMNWLQQQQQLGQMRAGMVPQALGLQQKQLGVMGGELDQKAADQLLARTAQVAALKPYAQRTPQDNMSLELARRMKVFDTLPMDNVQDEAAMMGMTPGQFMQAQMALKSPLYGKTQELIMEQATKHYQEPPFNGDVGKAVQYYTLAFNRPDLTTTLPPLGLSLEDNLKIADRADKIKGAYVSNPQRGLNLEALANTKALAEARGDQSTVSEIDKILSGGVTDRTGKYVPNFRRAEDVKSQEFQQNLGLGMWHAALEAQRIKGEQQRDLVTQTREVAKDQADMAWKLWLSPEATETTKNTAREALANAMNASGSIKGADGHVLSPQEIETTTRFWMRDPVRALTGVTRPEEFAVPKGKAQQGAAALAGPQASATPESKLNSDPSAFVRGLASIAQSAFPGSIGDKLSGMLMPHQAMSDSDMYRMSYKLLKKALPSLPYDQRQMAQDRLRALELEGHGDASPEQ